MCCQKWQSDHSIICYLPTENLMTFTEIENKWPSNEDSSPNKSRQAQVIFITNTFQVSEETCHPSSQ